MPRIVAVVPALDEADRIAATVGGLASLDPIDEVVVVDDGSVDGTSEAARRSGARVVAATRTRGKGAALEAGLEAAGRADVVLFADGDLSDSAANLGPVLAEVVEGRADLAIAVLPRPGIRGFGLVKRTAGLAIRALCGFRASEPLSGQRAVSARCLAACRPLARGFGVETGMTIDAVRGGFRVVEVPVDVTHRPTGRDPSGFAHRGRQGIDILLAAGRRLIGSRRGSGP